MNKQKIKVRDGFRPAIDKRMEPEIEHESVSDFQQKLKLLSAPYKHSVEYKFYEGKQRGIPNYELGISAFWDTKAGYIDKYENCGN